MPERDGGTDHSRRARRKSLVYAALRPLFSTVVLTLAYFLLPFHRIDDVSALILLILGAVLVFAMCAWQVRLILRVDYPLVQAAEALAMTFGVYLLGYSTVYYLMSAANPQAFTIPLTRLDALYFCVTVFATVGFGDIVAAVESTRAAVLVQMLGNLVLLGLALRLLTASVRERRRQLRHPVTPNPPAADR